MKPDDFDDRLPKQPDNPVQQAIQDDDRLIERLQAENARLQASVDYVRGFDLEKQEHRRDLRW